MLSSEALVYDEVKKALLTRYGISKELTIKGFVWPDVRRERHIWNWPHD